MSKAKPKSPSRSVAIITGGSRGLGRSMVLHLAAQGVPCIFTYVHNASDAQEVVSIAKQRGGEAVALQLDVADTSQFGPFASQVQKALAHLGAETFAYLVNNAGTAHHAPIMETTEADFDAMYGIHLKGVFFLTQKLLPLMRDGGRIINISSGLTRFSFPGSAAYASMKGAVEVLTRYLAKELGSRNISVNTVAPGAIETDFGGGTVRDNKQMNAQIASMTALGRVGLPDDVGGVVASLLTGDTHWVTGQRIEVSGGMLV